MDTTVHFSRSRRRWSLSIRSAVRRMMAARAMPVSYLKRLAEGGLSLGTLEKGAVRELDIASAEAALDKLPELF